MEYETNITVIGGRVTATPEMRSTRNGNDMAVTGLAHHLDNNTAFFVDVIGYGKTAQYMVANLRKGNDVTVTGALSVNQYETRSGEKRTSVSINANHIERHGAPPTIEEPKEEEAGELPF